MQRCLQLAANGLGHTLTNPMVGCVVVHNDKIIGEGFHRFYGGAHAEVEALKNIDDPAVLNESTVYVNLEPCSHQGKTPPCADLLIAKGVKRVVIASGDPNPLVNGRGIQKLSDAGIEVISGILDQANRELNKRFFTFHEKKRPYIVLKWAQSRDGWIAPKNHKGQFKLTGHLSDILVHRWRTEETGILVGRKTIEQDNPQLNVRHVNGKNPVRIILDPHHAIKEQKQVLDGTQDTLVYTYHHDQTQPHLSHVALPKENFLGHVLEDLYQRKIASVLVEGGAYTLAQFIDQNAWDEARIFECDVLLRQGISAPYITGRQMHHGHVGHDELTIIRNS
jgi:diaminohydroxyphosphoribosylaminopyrimidine deaminase/5-amino-6-(5-phosphoribosylamino)uracil reductase